MTALDDRPLDRGDARRCPPTCSTGGCSPPPRSTCSAPGRRPAPASGSPTGGSSRCRSTAGSRPPTPSTSRSSPTSRRPCSTSAAGPAAISPRCAPPASAGSASTSRPSRSGSPAAAAREAINGSLWSQVPRAGTWRTILLLDGNIGIGGAPILLLRRAGELLAAGGAIVVEVDPPGAPHASRPRPAGGAGRRVGVVPLGARRRRRRRRTIARRGGLRRRRGPRARGPHVRNAQTQLEDSATCPPPLQARSDRASGARPCAARG